MLFEKATRLKLRFNYRGVCSVEDLWDLDVEALDFIFKHLNSKLKTQKEESLLEDKNRLEEELELQVEIIRHIAKTKIEEAKEAMNVAKNKALKNRLLEIKAKKQDEKYEGLSEEELDKLLENL